MKQFLGFLKTTLLGGLVVIAPLVLTVLILIEAVDLVLNVLTPVVDLLPEKTVGGIAVATLIALGLVIGACFMAGLMLRSERGATLTDWIEKKILSLIPGYNMFRNIVRRIANVQETADLMPAVINTVPGTQVLAFVIEEHEDGDCTVFVPSSPALTVGSIQYVAKEKVRKLDAPIQQVANCILEWGAGSKPLFRPA
jgi:uncharacterized membrane protein